MCMLWFHDLFHQRNNIILTFQLVHQAYTYIHTFFLTSWQSCKKWPCYWSAFRLWLGKVALRWNNDFSFFTSLSVSSWGDFETLRTHHYNMFEVNQDNFLHYIWFLLLFLLVWWAWDMCIYFTPWIYWHIKASEFDSLVDYLLTVLETAMQTA